MKLLVGDCIEKLRSMAPDSVHTCVTSPPYWALRDYGVGGQIGLEATPEAYVARLVEVFREVRRVLRPDGTLWVNLGDSYARQGGTTDNTVDRRSRSLAHMHKAQRRATCKPPSGLKHKDLVGIPWRVALALQADGWILRRDIIWHKPNPMPESVSDRPTTAHEYIFLLSKRPRYYYNADAISEPCSESTHPRIARAKPEQGSVRANGGVRADRPMGPVLKGVNPKAAQSAAGSRQNESFAAATAGAVDRRNKRSVWTVGTQGFRGAHFATFPPKLIEPCVIAGAPPGGTVLDPFAGTCTTGYVALAHGRNFIGIELNPEYAELAKRRVPGLEVR